MYLPPFRLIFQAPRALSRVQWRSLEEPRLGRCIESLCGQLSGTKPRSSGNSGQVEHRGSRRLWARADRGSVMKRCGGTGQGQYWVSMYLESSSHCAAFHLEGVTQSNPRFQLAQSQSLAPKAAVLSTRLLPLKATD